MSELERYTKAMIAGNTNLCLRIEEENDLIGYPPEVVSVALGAIDDGQSPWPVIESFLYGDDHD